jgi:uncharacterized sporulation protein YeaH/YhbH (DUF444 family)
MMDVSGLMGPEQKEIVRLESSGSTRGSASQYNHIELRYIVHDAAAKEVDYETFFTSARRRHQISSAYRLCHQMITEQFAPGLNIYLFHFSDGE